MYEAFLTLTNTAQDITSLLIQGAGGGLAGTGTTPSAVRTVSISITFVVSCMPHEGFQGSNIILVGLGVQIGTPL